MDAKLKCERVMNCEGDFSSVSDRRKQSNKLIDKNYKKLIDF